MNAQVESSTAGQAFPLPTRDKREGMRREPLRQANVMKSALPHWVFVTTLLAVMAMGWSLYDSSVKGQRSSAWVVHTYEVLGAMSAVEEELSRAESALRGYVVSGHPSFLLQREIALTSLTDALMRLAPLVSDNPPQQSRAHQLLDLIDQRVGIMKETLRQYEAGGAEAAATTLQSARLLMSRIDSLISEMEEIERNHLDARRAQEQSRHDRTMLLLAAAGALALLILVPSYVAFVREIHARAHVRRRLFDMADSIPGVVYRYRSRAEGTSHYEFLSTGVESLYGVEREAALRDASVIADTVAEEDRAALSETVAKAASGLTPLQYDFRIRTKDGTVKWVRSSAAPRLAPDGTIVWNGHWADITEQKKLEHELHDSKETADRASRAKGTFLAVMSHEIRTPLNGVLGMLELLSLTKLNAEQRTTLNVVRESGKSLQRIIDDILDFSKIEAGKLEIASEPASIAQVVESTRNIFAGNASSKGLVLTAAIDEELSPAVMVDPLRLRQILSNFVSNAIKFTFEGTIEIGAEMIERRADTEVIRFTVADRGIGMSPDAQARLFEPFMQGGVATARTYGGTGLGLTICRRLAEMMGGSVDVESELGHGTTMVLTLPVTITDPAALQPLDLPHPVTRTVLPTRSAPSLEQAEREGTLVLIVDDHPVNRLVLSRQVSMLGYAAECANNGLEALQKWASGRFSLVVTDCNMPEMDGYELARRIRDLESTAAGGRMPIIACTANALRGEAEACFEAGMDDYLAKPVGLAELQSKLSQWRPLPDDRTAQPAKPVQQDRDPTASIFDRAVIASLTGGGKAEEREVLMAFQSANAEDTLALRQAYARNDFAEVMHASHRISGASRMVGLTALAAACARVEHAARVRDLVGLERDMTRLDRELERARECISTETQAAAA